MDSFPETYNYANRLRRKRWLYSTKASKASPIKLLRQSWRERERERAKKEELGGGGREKRKHFPANPTMLWNAS